MEVAAVMVKVVVTQRRQQHDPYVTHPWEQCTVPYASRSG